MLRDVVLREEYPEGGARETLACGHVIYLTKKQEAAVRRCLLCIRKGGTNGKRSKRRGRGARE